MTLLLDTLAQLPHEHALTLSSIEHDIERAEHGRLEALLSQALHRDTHLFANTSAPPKLGHASPDTPKLTLTDYLEGQAQPPDHIWRGLFPGFTDVLGNDKWGDCGEALAVHGFEAIQAAAGNPVSKFTEADTLELYTQVGGFDPNAGPPGQNPTDNGTNNQTLMKVLRNPGLKCAADGTFHKVAAAVDVPVGNEVAEKIAVAEFVVLWRAVALPLNAQGKSTWWLRGDGTTGDAAPASWGYHDVPYLGYSKSGNWDVDSWGQLIPAGPRFDRRYGTQGLAVVTTDMLGRGGVSPTGLNYTKLLADIQALGSHVV